MQQFIFETIIPEVLKSIIPEKFDEKITDRDFNDGHSQAREEIKQKSKELY